MWVYYKEQCEYCYDRDDCSYKEKVKEYINKLNELDKSSKGFYGKTEFWCDYYLLDMDRYNILNIGEVNNG